MKLSGNSGFALLLIGFGILILLNQFGLGLGSVMSYLIPIAMAVLGYVGMKNGRTVIGAVLFAFGCFILLGKLSWLFGFIIAIGFIWYGVTMLKRRPKIY